VSVARIVTAPGVRPVMQVAVGDADVAVGQAVYDTARYDDYPDATYSGLDAQWTDDTCDVIEAVTFYGRQRSVDQFDVGTATLRVANPDGLWDYPPTSDATVLTLRPGRQLRVGVIPEPDVPGYWTDAVAYVPGYLTPTVGTVTTPDPGPLPNDFVVVFKVQGPTTATAPATANQTIASQYDADPQRSWLLRRVFTNGQLAWTFTPTGTAAAATGRSSPTTATPITAGADEYVAIANTFNDGLGGGTPGHVSAYRSTDGGATWTPQGTTTNWVATTAFDSTGPVRVGAWSTTGDKFYGRIYWCELRTGLDPAAGTVVWRFDADDYPGGSVTSYTDPRGRTWTLTAAAAITPKVPAVPPVWVPPVQTPPVWLWHGWIDATAPGYDPNVGDVVDVSCICAKGEAGRTELARLETAVGDGETVTARMGRYADGAAFPAHRRQFDPGATALAGTTLGGRVGALMDRSARSAGGDVFGDQNGMLVYRSQDWQAHAGPPDAYIGNRGYPGEVCPNAWDVMFTRSDFTTRVNYGQSGQPVATLDDAANQAKFGVETYTMTDLETVDAATRTLLAQRVLRVRNFNLAPRIAACTLDAAQPGVADLLAAADPFAPSLYSCGHVTRDGRAVFARSMLLTGIEHTITAGSWLARLALDDAAPWATTAETRYDTARYDVDYYAKAV
jgi:hypothetical protein